MANLIPASDAVFSVKTFAAAMLAYYLALSCGMDRAYWAVITTYIVSQPLAGAVRSKAVFRLLGTVIGAVVAVVLVSALADAQALLILALGGWVGLCTYIGVLNRTPRSYLFLLAGYSAVIIGVPAATAPATTYAIASLRVQEIVIGIVCATAVHSIVFPRSVLAYLHRRAEAILLDASRWSRDALGKAMPPSGSDAMVAKKRAAERDRRRLAIDIQELHLLAVHLPFDTAIPPWRIVILQAFQEQLSRSLPLAATIEARIAQLRDRGDLPAEIESLIDDVDHWLAASAGRDGGAADARHLMARARHLEPQWQRHSRLAWTDILRLDLLDRLASLVRVHAISCQLCQIMTAGIGNMADELRPILAVAKRRSLHRDHSGAAQAAIATFLTVVMGNVIWIVTAWPEGAGAVIIATIVCALFSTSDDPAPAARRVLHGSGISVLVCGIYAFGILPLAQGFASLVFVLAPFFLAIGVLLPRPRWGGNAIGMLLTAPGLLALDNRYTLTFDGFANASIAQLLGTVLAVVMLGLVRSVAADKAAWRVRQAGKRDLRRRLDFGAWPDSTAWIGRMTDRMGLLAPSGRDSESMGDVLTVMRIGLAIDDVTRFRLSATGRDAAAAALMLRHLQAHLAKRSAVSERPGGKRRPRAAQPRLLWVIDTMLRRLNDMPPERTRRHAMLALTDLRSILFADASSMVKPIPWRSIRDLPA